MDAINDIIEKVCTHMKKILDAWVKGVGVQKGPKTALFQTLRSISAKMSNNFEK